MNEPMLALFPTTGARVQVALEDTVLVCRLQAIRDGLLQLAAPADLSGVLPARVGTPVGLRIYHDGRCLEATARTRQWVWTRPPILVVGPVAEWREACRRRAPRAPRELRARLLLPDGTEWFGRTRDVSALGASLVLPGSVELQEGASGKLALQHAGGLWSEDMAVRVARARRWFRSSGRCLDVGLELVDPADTLQLQGQGWMVPTGGEAVRGWLR